MKKILSCILILALLCTALPIGCAAEEQAPDFSVILPEDFEAQGTRRYPVLYLIPEDGLSETSEIILDQIRQSLLTDEVMDMLVVCPRFSSPAEGGDAFAQIEAIVRAVDEQYPTIPDSAFRAVAGVGDGGYLAAMLCYSDAEGQLRKEPGLFSLLGCLSGHFAAEGNIWLPCYGSFSELLQNGKFSNADALRFYSFLSAASEDPESYREGGANDVIACFIRQGAAYGGVFADYWGNADESNMNLTIRHGADDESFRRGAVHSMLAGMSDKLVLPMLEGTLRVTPQAAGAEVEQISAEAELNVSESCLLCLGEAEEAANGIPNGVSLSLVLRDPESGETLAEAAAPDGTAELPNLVLSDHADVCLRASLLGMTTQLASVPLLRIRASGDAPEEKLVDLAGEWKFLAAPSVTPGELPAPGEYAAWESVVPGLGWWDSAFSAVTDMKAYSGYAWYAKDFTIPADFPAGDYTLALGCFDETDLVFVNGTMVGGTGLDPESWQHEADCWDTERQYTVDASLLQIGGENSVLVLTHNLSGDGGWYSGHPTLYVPEAWQAVSGGGEALGETVTGRFFELEIPATDMPDGEETEHLLICLPEGYFDPENAERRYPVAYLLHQLNSTGRSYAIDGLDTLLAEAMRGGEIREMILVAPESSPDSFWMDGWDSLVAEQIVPYIDANYRTVPDAGHRIVAGASMGGHGAFHLALRYPELFRHVISYFGAINMGSNPLEQIRAAAPEELADCDLYFICGFMDLYKFSLPAIELDRILREKNIEHWFELGCGGHDSAFYLPYAVDSFAWQSARLDP